VKKQQLAKKTKAMKGFPLKKFSFMIGNITTTNDAATQFMAVAKGTYLGSTVSEI
jgi:pyridoxal biosynthesis lyase PdxS